MSWYVYILRCGDGTLYTGVTDNVPRRLAAHRGGKGAKYTRGRGPLELAYMEEVPDKSAALRREAAVKRLRRREKERLIQEAKNPFFGKGSLPYDKKHLHFLPESATIGKEAQIAAEGKGPSNAE